MYSIAGVGTVVGGTIRSGTVKEGDDLLLGPSDDGTFFPVTVGSIHRNRLPCRIAVAGHTACIAIGKTDPCPLRKVTTPLSLGMKHLCRSLSRLNTRNKCAEC